MIGLIFELDDEKLKNEYGNNYFDAYQDIQQKLKKYSFHLMMGNLYVNARPVDRLTDLCEAIDDLKSISWFSNSLKKIKTFDMNNMSDFTDIVRFGEDV